jgi:pimeloyl-ACP methyl ester carboxylesterase
VNVMGIALAAILMTAAAAAGLLYLAPERVTRFVVERGRRRAGLVRKEIDLPGGLQYVCLEGGSGEPLVLLHGFGGMKDNFAEVARFLTPRFRIVIPDQIGFAESSHPRDGDYSSHGQAGHLHALLQVLGIGCVHIGGNSMGGQIALAYAARYRSEVASLWLLDPGGVHSAPRSEMVKRLEAGGRNPYLIESVEHYAHMIKFVMRRPPCLPRPVLEVLAQDSIRNLELQRHIFRTIRDDALEDRITGLTTPTLIVWGEDDPVWHVGTAEILHELVPNSQVVIMPGVRHVPMMEEPRQCAEDYLRFRDSLPKHR